MRAQLARPRVVLAAVLAVLVAGLVVLTTRGGSGDRTLVADFSATDSLYAGADVRVLGVPVGHVTRIVSKGDHVEVHISYRAAQPLPADVGAVIVPPSLVGDDYVQLTPVYTGGPQLADGAVLDVHRTAVPVGLDQIYGSLDSFAAALGPNGANKTGALSDLLTVTAKNLSGHGAQVNATITGLASAAQTLASHRGDLTATTDALASFTSTLSADDPGVRQLATQLATVSTELNGDRDDIDGAVVALNDALGQVAHFVAANKNALTVNVANIAQVAQVLAGQSAALAHITDVSPVALSDILDAYLPEDWDPAHPDAIPVEARTGAINSRGNVPATLGDQLATTIDTACKNAGASTGPLASVCATIGAAGGSLGDILTGVLGPVVGGGGVGTPSSAKTLAGLLSGTSR